MKNKKKRIRPEHVCACGLCKPVPGKKYDPVWGVDLAQLKKTDCLLCSKKIGNAKYVFDIALARFGQMFVAHKTCNDKAEKDWAQRRGKRKKETGAISSAGVPQQNTF